MLSEIDKRVLNGIYSVIGSKYISSPITWNNSRMSQKSNYGRRHSFMFAVIIFCEFTLRLKQLLFTISEKDIIGSIIQSIYTARPVLHLIFRLNIWIFKTNFIRLVNQTLAVDSIWSK